jgi:hypothetical protein
MYGFFVTDLAETEVVTYLEAERGSVTLGFW